MMRGTLVGAVMGAALFALPAGSAQASSQNVVQVIEAQDKILQSDPAIAAAKNFEKVKTVAAAKKLIPEVNGLVVKLDHAATLVSQASATSSQKVGQTEWVTAAHDEATGEHDLVLGLSQLIKGEQSGVATLKKVTAPIEKGDALAVKARKLLGIPVGS